MRQSDFCINNVPGQLLQDSCPRSFMKYYACTAAIFLEAMRFIDLMESRQTRIVSTSAAGWVS